MFPETNAKTTTASIAFDAAADFYDRTRGFPPQISDEIGDHIARGIPEPRGSVLEVGIGTGRIALPLIERGFNIVGVDLSLPMMRKLRGKLAGEKVIRRGSLNLVRGDIVRLPIGTATQQAVIEVHVLHLVPEWQQALGEMRRVLRSDGILIHGHAAGQHGSQAPWSPWIEVRTRWREILAGMGHLVEWVGTKSDQQLVASIQKEASHFEELPRATWTSMDSFGRALSFLAERCFSDTWRLPDEVFRQAIRELERWLQGEHPDLEKQYEVQHVFHLYRARF